MSKEYKRELNSFFHITLNLTGDKELGECDCELVAICSRTDFRKGLGIALVNEMIRRCSEQNANIIRLFTNTMSSYHFYDKYGFRVVKEKSFSYEGNEGMSLVYEYVIK